MPELEVIKQATFHSEREVETKFVVPILSAIGYEGREIVEELYVPNVEAVEKASGKKVQHRKPDFIIFDSGYTDLEHTLIVIEAKDPRQVADVINDYNTLTQAWAYAKALAAPRFCTTNGDEFAVYQLDIFSDDPADSRLLYSFKRDKLDKSVIHDLKSLIGKRAILALRDDSADELKELRVRQANMTAAAFTDEIAQFTGQLRDDILDKIKRMRRQDPNFAKKLEDLESDNIRKLSDDADDDLALRAAYDFLFKLIFAKIYEDKGYSNGIRFVPTFLERKKETLKKPLPQFVGEIVEDAFSEVGKSYSRLFQPHEIFSRLVPSPAIIAAIVEEISSYNFKEVTNDMLGDVYHRALIAQVSRREKGSFFTPRYIVNEIIKSIPVEELKPEREDFAAADLFCGSGTFLLGLYDELKKYCKNYVGYGDKYAHEWILGKLYGNDIDPFATMLSIINLILRDAMHRNGWHIAQGDSFKFKQFSHFADERSGYSKELLAQYAEVFGHGYDLIVSNPPYGASVSDEMKANFRDYFKEVQQGGYDTYRFAIFEAVELLKPGGYMGFIVPNTWLTIKSAEKLRKYILAHCRIVRLVNLQQNVFCLKGAAANVDTMLVILQRNRTAKPFENDDNMVDVCIMPNKTDTPEEDLAKGRFKLRHSVRQGDWRENFATEIRLIFDEKEDMLWRNVEEDSLELGKISEIHFGKQLRDRKKYKNDVLKRMKSLNEIPEGYEPCYTGEDVSRYFCSWNGLACLLDRTAKRGGCWDEEFHHSRPKLLTKQIGPHPEFAIENLGIACLNTIFMVVPKPEWNPLFLLGLLNSKIIKAYWHYRFEDKRPTFPKIKGTYLLLLPIRPAPPEVQTGFAEKVDKMLALNEELVRRENVGSRPASTATETGDAGVAPTEYADWAEDKIKKAIAATDAEIDRMVYDLYGLTDEEIAIVEESAK